MIGSDLVDYGDPTHFYRRDFLMERKAPDGCAGDHHESACSSWPSEFVAHALDLSPLVIMLLRLAPSWRAERRTGFSKAADSRASTSSRKRLPMMHRARLGRPQG